MNNLLLYLLEASALMIALYGSYWLLLRKETFFTFNRYFLVGALVLALLLPVMNFDFLQPGKGLIQEQISDLGKARQLYYLNFENWSDLQAQTSIDQSLWDQFWSEHGSFWGITRLLIVTIYLAGLLFLLVRLYAGYRKIYRLKKRLPYTEIKELKVTKIPASMTPFSFLGRVFIPEDIQGDREFDQILAHEKTHVRQRHSIDLIFVQLLAAFLWFNPAVWLLIKSLKQTHEYIADRNMLTQGFSLVEYQSLLLKQLISDNSYGLVHHFNLSFIKKRITMMSIKQSGWVGRSKAVTALSFILLIGMLTVQSNTLVAIPSAALTKADGPLQMRFFVDGISLEEGLDFSKVSSAEGAFKFEVNNDQKDRIRVGLNLVRKGRKVGVVTQELQEHETMNIGKLLRVAEREDYIIIDIIEGPEDVTKLYNFPLFRGSSSWKKNQASDLPPAPVELFVLGKVVDRKKGVSFSKLATPGAEAELEYVLSEFVDFEVLARQAGDVTTTLVRKGKAVKSTLTKGVQPKASIPLVDLLEVAEKGDAIVIQIGDPDGFSIASSFMLN